MKLNFFNFLKKHYWCLGMAIGVGVIIAWPQILLMQENGYEGIIFTGTDSEEYYNGRIREVYDGHFTLTSHDLYEYKDKPYVQSPVPEIIIAGLGRILSLEATQMISFGKFFFPFLLYLIIYFFLFELTKSRGWALAIAAAVLLNSNLIHFPSNIGRLLSFKLSDLALANIYMRPVNPQLSSLIFFTWMYIFYQWLKTDHRSLWIILIILFGLSFYIYPYLWMFQLVLLGVSSIFEFFKRNIFNAPMKKIILLIVGGLIISAPFWINYFQLIFDPWYESLQKHYGFYHSRGGLWSNLIFIDIVALFFLYWRKPRNLIFYYFLAIFVSLFVLINQQLITGIRFYPGHWHWYYTTPFTIIILLLLVRRLTVSLHPMISRVIWLGIIIVSLCNGLVNQHNFYLRFKDYFLKNQKYEQIFSWLNKKLERDDIVLTHDELNVYLPIYTSANSFVTHWGQLYLMPQLHLRETFFFDFYLNGVDEKNVFEYINSENRSVKLLLYGYYRLRAGLCQDGCFTESEIKKLQQDYLTFYNNFKIEDFLNKYRVDYAVWDIAKRPNYNLDRFQIFLPIKEINGIKIYKILN